MAVQTTVVLPIGNAYPELKLHSVEYNALSSVAVAVYVTAALPAPVTGMTEMFEGHTVNVGATVSKKLFTPNWHVEVSPILSVAVHVTTLLASVNVDPDAGEHVTVGVKPELSVAVGSVHVTFEVV